MNIQTDVFRLTIETNNDAFTNGRKPIELARLLNVVAKRIRNGETEGQVRDANGNTVGRFEVT